MSRDALIRFLKALGDESGSPLTFEQGVAAGELYRAGWRVEPPLDAMNAGAPATGEDAEAMMRDGEPRRDDMPVDEDALAVALMSYLNEQGPTELGQLRELFEGPVGQTVNALVRAGRVRRRGQLVTVPPDEQ